MIAKNISFELHLRKPYPIPPPLLRTILWYSDASFNCGFEAALVGTENLMSIYVWEIVHVMEYAEEPIKTAKFYYSQVVYYYVYYGTLQCAWKKEEILGADSEALCQRESVSPCIVITSINCKQAGL